MSPSELHNKHEPAQFIFLNDRARSGNLIEASKDGCDDCGSKVATSVASYMTGPTVAVSPQWSHPAINSQSVTTTLLIRNTTCLCIMLAAESHWSSICTTFNFSRDVNCCIYNSHFSLDVLANLCHLLHLLAQFVVFSCGLRRLFRIRCIIADPV